MYGSRRETLLPGDEGCSQIDDFVLHAVDLPVAEAFLGSEGDGEACRRARCYDLRGWYYRSLSHWQSRELRSPGQGWCRSRERAEEGSELDVHDRGVIQ
jgi:hypothetical protein